MQLWPSHTQESIAAHTLHMPPRVYAKSIALEPGQKTTSDFYPYHDVFIYVAHGSCIVHTENGTEKMLHASDSVIVHSRTSYWFETSDTLARVLEITLGEDEQEDPHEHQYLHGWTHQSLFILEGQDINICGRIHQHAMDQYGQTEEILDIQDLGKKQDISPELKTIPVSVIS